MFDMVRQFFLEAVALIWACTDLPCSGNVIGYHITMPCQVCLHSCNNGHFWMFRTEGVVAADRLNGIGKAAWGADCLCVCSASQW